ncbi:MAG: PorP/SprF family type IX secretion system membrane protein [Saprospiraceae bacterium]
MKTLLPFLFLLLLAKTITAQDPTFSQFNFNKLYLNPAFAGHNGGTSFNFNNHHHLVRVPGEYRVTSASMDTQSPCNNLGFGLMFMNEQEGVVPIQRNTFALSGAYIFDKVFKEYFKGLKFDNDKELAFSVGLALKYVQVAVNTDNAIFSSQLDNIRGIVGTAPITNAMLGNTDYVDSDIGFVGVYNQTGFLLSNITFSFSINHLRATNPDESLQDLGVLRPTKYTSYAAFDFPFHIGKAHFNLSPHFLFNKQGTLENFIWGTYLMGNVTKQSSTGVYGGFFYENTWYPSLQDANSFIINVGINGIEFNNSPTTYSIGYSLDIPNRGLNLGTSHEVSIRVNLPGAAIFCPTGAQNLLNCNKFIQ